MTSSVLKLRQTIRKRRAQWGKFRSFPRPYQRLFWQSVVMLPLNALALRCLGFKRTQAWLAKTSEGGKSASVAVDWPDLLPSVMPDSLPERVHVTRACVHYAAKMHRGRFTCLPQSLSLWWLLRRQGFDPNFRLGVRHISEQFEAHAWIEYEGHSLEFSQATETPFSPFEQPISPGWTPSTTK